MGEAQGGSAVQGHDRKIGEQGGAYEPNVHGPSDGSKPARQSWQCPCTACRWAKAGDILAGRSPSHTCAAARSMRKSAHAAAGSGMGRTAHRQGISSSSMLRVGRAGRDALVCRRSRIVIIIAITPTTTATAAASYPTSPARLRSSRSLPGEHTGCKGPNQASKARSQRLCRPWRPSSCAGLAKERTSASVCLSSS